MSRLVQVWLGDDLQATLDPNQTFPPRRDKVLQVIEADENFRMLLCHDGINSVVLHVPPKTLDLYRAGITQIKSTNNSSSMEHDDVPNSEDQNEPLVPTLNLLATNACLIQISDWQWSTSICCGAWLRGPLREKSRALCGKSSPFCIQIGKLSHAGVNLPHNIYSNVELVDVNKSPKVAKLIDSFKTHHDSFQALKLRMEQSVSSSSSSLNKGMNKGAILDAYGRDPLTLFKVSGPLSLDDIPLSVRQDSYKIDNTDKDKENVNGKLENDNISDNSSDEELTQLDDVYTQNKSKKRTKKATHSKQTNQIVSNQCVVASYKNQSNEKSNTMNDDEDSESQKEFQSQPETQANYHGTFKLMDSPSRSPMNRNMNQTQIESEKEDEEDREGEESTQTQTQIESEEEDSSQSQNQEESQGIETQPQLEGVHASKRSHPSPSQGVPSIRSPVKQRTPQQHPVLSPLQRLLSPAQRHQPQQQQLRTPVQQSQLQQKKKTPSSSSGRSAQPIPIDKLINDVLQHSKQQRKSMTKEYSSPVPSLAIRSSPSPMRNVPTRSASKQQPVPEQDEEEEVVVKSKKIDWGRLRYDKNYVKAQPIIDIRTSKRGRESEVDKENERRQRMKLQQAELQRQREEIRREEERRKREEEERKRREEEKERLRLEQEERRRRLLELQQQQQREKLLKKRLLEEHEQRQREKVLLFRQEQINRQVQHRKHSSPPRARLSNQEKSKSPKAPKGGSKKLDLADMLGLKLPPRR